MNKIKENFSFFYLGHEYIRHSERAILRLVKEMEIKPFITLFRDVGYWNNFGADTQSWAYHPRYKKRIPQFHNY